MEKVQQTFGVDVSIDEEAVHPQHICKQCYSKLFLITKRSAHTWKPHPRTTQCEMCILFSKQSKGGRPTKPYTGKGRPKKPESTVESHFSSSLSQMEDRQFPVLGNDCNFSSTSEVFNCKVCTHFLKLPVALPCEHTFCLECVKGICEKKHKNKNMCPLCNLPFQFVQVEHVKDYYLETVLTSRLQCNTCSEIVTQMQLRTSTHVIQSQ